MKILLWSHTFAPHIGGLESMARLLAKEFVAAGHDVTVATMTAADGPDDYPFQVVRQPTLLQMLRAVRTSDVVLENPISLRLAWTLPLGRAARVVRHPTWLDRGWNRAGITGAVKRWLLRFSTSIANSDAIAASLPVPAHVIGNAYDDTVFRVDAAAARDRTLVFVGRLIPGKGADMALDALARLRDRGIEADLTVIGLGPQDAALRAQAARLGLTRQVDFAGPREGVALARLIARHRVIVIPSRWQEPFGIVALEGIACGCVAVGSAGGGLKDAIGPCGLTFLNDDTDAMVDRLASVLTDRDLSDRLRARAPAHLAARSPRAVAQAYLRVLEDAVRRGR